VSTEAEDAAEAVKYMLDKNPTAVSLHVQTGGDFGVTLVIDKIQKAWSREEWEKLLGSDGVSIDLKRLGHR
jgi:hypothetical protein